MLSGLDLEIVGIYIEHIEETLCLTCAANKLGSLRAERIITGLDTAAGYDRVPRWQANEDATARGYDCGCARNVPDDEFCENCAEALCSECGARLDDHNTTPAAAACPRAG